MTDPSVTVRGVFATGASVGHVVGDLAPGPTGNGCDAWNTVASIELQVRYAVGWSIVLAPRIERGQTLCN